LCKEYLNFAHFKHQYNLTADEELNMFIYGTPFYFIITEE